MFSQSFFNSFLNPEGNYGPQINSDIFEDNIVFFDDNGPTTSSKLSSNESKIPISTFYTGNTKEEEKIINEKKNEDFHRNTIFPSKKPKEMKIGRKRKDGHEIGKHNKNTDDIIINKSINAVKDSALKYLNKNIKDVLGDEYTLKKIRPFSKKINSHKELMNKTCREIFSTEIHQKFKKLEKNYNQKMIDKILDKEKENKNEANIFNYLFNLKFSDFLSNFKLAKGEMPSELSGMENIDDFLSKYEDEEYKNKFKAFVGDLEKIIGDKKGRNRTKKSKII